MSKGGDLKFLHLNWGDVQMLSEKVAEKIKACGFKPDLIVAVSRGGFDPARILCDQLGIRRLACLQVEYYSGVNQKLDHPRVVYPLNADVGGLHVLVVDDVSDTGVSLRFVRDYVLDRGATEVKIAVLHIKTWTDFMPDFFAEQVDSWIVYPWEPLETICSLAGKLKEEGLSDVEVKSRLEEIGFSTDMINRLKL